ncbi:TopI - like protein YobL [Bacillus velezensis]|uniref:ADP-ribosyltransferase n=2 Tax=Bacillaceae TaxID=186817 RepID=UPI000BA7E30B|nr:TopI - like protein YobL [Bacillus velezensis]
MVKYGRRKSGERTLYMKLLETNTLIQSANSRLKAYQKTKDDMIALKQQFHGIANTDAMSGKGADAIKAFYSEQAAGAELWLDLCDMKITFFKSIPREIEQAGFGRHDLLEESFLDSELKHAGQRAYHIIDGQHDEISRILGSIDDILSLSPFDKSSVTGKLDASDHKKRQTAEHLHKLDAKLVHEYAQSEALEHEVEAFFRTLANLTSKAGGPQSFNAKAFHDTDVYKRKDSMQKQAHQYIKMKQQEETAFLQKKLDRISDPDEYINIAEKLGADNMSAEQLQYYSSLVQLKAMRQAGQMLVDGAKGITLGIWDAGKDTVIGAYDFAIWLQRAQGHAGTIEQAKAGQELIGAIYNAPETFDYMVQSFKTSWNENIIHGDTYSRTHYIAYAAVSLLGAKGAGEVTGVTRAGRFVTKEAKTFIADQKKVAAGIYTKGKSSISQPWKPALAGIGESPSPAGKAIDVKQETLLNFNGSFRDKRDLDISETSPRKIDNLEQAHIWGEKHYDKWINSLTAEEKQALIDYTGDYYEDINAYLRGVNSSLNGINPTKITDIHSALEKAKIPEDIVVYRGTDLIALRKILPRDEVLTEGLINNLVGQRIKDDAFTSTALLKESAFDYKKVSYSINVPKGTNGAYIAKVSHFPEEAEILLNSGHEMIIRDAKLDADEKIHLVLDLIKK